MINKNRIDSFGLTAPVRNSRYKFDSDAKIININ